MDQNTVAEEGAQFDPARERTTLVNALAEAARAALEFDFMSAAVLGAIPGTEPQQYVIAGTPAGISKMLPTVAAPSPVSEAQAEQASAQAAEVRDAARYRWLRSKDTSLETRQFDKGVYNGASCYHEVEGIRELKWGVELDAAIDAAIRSAVGTGEQADA